MSRQVANAPGVADAQVIVSAQGLSYSFSEKMVFRAVSFDLLAGETLALVGASGCGKSTLLHLLAGLKHNFSCEGLLELSPSLKKALVMQHFGLFPWKTVRDNVELPGVLAGVPEPCLAQRSQQLFVELGLSELVNHYPAQLSGGQQQRVALGRALMLEPELLLLDEPFSSLDALTKEKLQDQLLKLWRNRNLSYILATHDIEEAVFLGRRILVMGGSPTQIVAQVENPGFGQREMRFSPDYFELVKTVRRSLELGSIATDPA